MKPWLRNAGEMAVGVILWYGSYAWGAILGAALTCAPLLVAYTAAQLVDGLPATVALAVGVVGAFVLDLPPWHAEERLELPLVVGGAAVSAVVFDLIRGSADVWTLVTALALTIAGWPIRRALSRRGMRWDAG